MIYELITRFFGSGIASIIYFLAMVAHYDTPILEIETQLQCPVTDEIASIVKKDFTFRIEYYGSVIINDKKAFNTKTVNELSYRDGWVINGESVAENEIQERMGRVSLQISLPELKENDEILVFIKGTILPDDEFKKSTGLTTRILWNYYIPRIKMVFVYQAGRMAPK